MNGLLHTAPVLQSGTELAMQAAVVLLALVAVVLLGLLVARALTGEFAPSSLRERVRSGYRTADDGEESSE